MEVRTSKCFISEKFKFIEAIKVCNCQEARQENIKYKEQENDGQVRKAEWIIRRSLIFQLLNNS